MKGEGIKNKVDKYKCNENNGQETGNPVTNNGENEMNEMIEERKNLIEERDKLTEEIENINEEREKQEKETEELRTQLLEAKAKYDECFGMLQRIVAEFDNYKKRTQKEKETYSKEITCEVIASFIPVLDNLERALNAAMPGCDANSIRAGVELVYNQFGEILSNFGVEPIKCVGEKFDPTLHDAVMHIKDEAYGENTVVEEFRKGYKVEGKVIRHSMVKVAN